MSTPNFDEGFFARLHLLGHQTYDAHVSEHGGGLLKVEPTTGGVFFVGAATVYKIVPMEAPKPPSPRLPLAKACLSRCYWDTEAGSPCSGPCRIAVAARDDTDIPF